MNEKQVGRISKALGDPYRLKMLEAIHEKEDWLQSGEILELIDLAQSTVSHHLKQLVDADLVIAEKEGRNAKYRINKPVFSEYIQFLSQNIL